MLINNSELESTGHLQHLKEIDPHVHSLKGTDKTWVTVDNTGSAKKKVRILASKESNIIYHRSENLGCFQSDQSSFLILSLLLFTIFWYAILPLLSRTLSLKN